MGRKLLAYIDLPLATFAVLLIIIGLLNLYSATYNLTVAKYFHTQLIWTCFGFLITASICLVDYIYLDRWTYPLYFLVLAMLIVLLLFGQPIAGSTRWFRLGPISIQPSELMKIVTILALAKYFKGRKDTPPYGLFQLLVPSLLILVPMGLINLQPDLGTSLAIGAAGFAIMFFVGIQRRTLIGIGFIILLLIPIAWFFVLSPYQQERLTTFIQPEKYSQEGGYQVIQSKIAVGSGQITGKGFLKGTQTKLMFLPKQYTDFVFSNYAEEWGFLGSFFLLGCFLLFLLSGLHISLKAKDRFGTLTAFGLTAYFFCHVVINIGMEIGLLPVVGLPLPFLSYGGSVTVTSFAAIGLLLNISMRRFHF